MYSNIYLSLSPFPLSFITFLISYAVLRRCAIVTPHVFLSFLSNLCLFFPIPIFYSMYLHMLVSTVTHRFILCLLPFICPGSVLFSRVSFLITYFTNFKSQFLILFTINVFVSIFHKTSSVLRCFGHHFSVQKKKTSMMSQVFISSERFLQHYVTHTGTDITQQFNTPINIFFLNSYHFFVF